MFQLKVDSIKIACNKRYYYHTKIFVKKGQDWLTTNNKNNKLHDEIIAPMQHGAETMLNACIIRAGQKQRAVRKQEIYRKAFIHSANIKRSTSQNIQTDENYNYESNTSFNDYVQDVKE